MGAAVVTAKLERKQLSVCWAGDSRAYLFNPDTGLRPVSRDHSYVQWLLSQEKITESEARTHPKRNLVTQCLGLKAPQPELNTVAWTPGEILLLCSDGLTGELDDEHIERILNNAMSAEDTCEAATEELITATLAAGAKDNVTVLLAENRCETDAAPVTPQADTESPQAPRAISWLPILLGAGSAVLVLILGVLWHLRG
jgi:protein phosphatase